MNEADWQAWTESPGCPAGTIDWSLREEEDAKWREEGAADWSVLLMANAVRLLRSVKLVEHQNGVARSPYAAYKAAYRLVCDQSLTDSERAAILVDGPPAYDRWRALRVLGAA